MQKYKISLEIKREIIESEKNKERKRVEEILVSKNKEKLKEIGVENFTQVTVLNKSDLLNKREEQVNKMNKNMEKINSTIESKVNQQKVMRQRKEEINKRDIFYYPKSKKFVGISFTNQNFYKIFKSVQFAFSENDKKIVSIGGRIFFPNDIQGCLKKKDEIVKEL